MIPGFSSFFIIWWKVATHPSILYVSRKYRSHSMIYNVVFSLLHYKPLWKGVWKQRPKSLGRQSGLKTGHWKVAHSCFHYVYFFPQNIWENLIPPFNIYCGGLASLVKVPQGTLSHTHLGSDTVALNETWRLHLGLSFQSDAVLCCIPSPFQKPSQSGGRIKIRDCEGHT